MSIKALQDYTYISKYAKYNKSKKRRETWNESVDRVRDMHFKKYADRIKLFPELADDINWAFEQVRQKRVLGSQRALQFGGEPILKKNARIYNCSMSFCDRIRFFQEALFMLLCGSGVGFSVQKHHIAKLPEFSDKLQTNKNGVKFKGKKIYVIPDSIEGWSDSLGILLASYIPHSEFSEYEGYEVEFDYSEIRPAGSSISSGSGKAPGPEPLKRSLEIIRELLSKRVVSGCKKLRPIDAYDIVMHASDAVLSGGVRRSATLCLFSPDDEEMATAKTGNWFEENPQRARSNNSALLVKNKTSKKEFDKLMNSVREFGEPGFVFADSTEMLPNPCVEISTWPVCVITKESGFQMCNLTEQNGKKIKSKEDWVISAKAASIIGTLQAGYTDFDYLGPVSKRITEREALLGVSITGMMDNPSIIFDIELQKEMAKLVLDVNENIAKKLGINPCARATCVKPAGTTSCVLGTSSGIHPHHAKRYLRRVQCNSMETPLQWFKKFNPFAVEKSVWSANKTDEVISFCVEVPDGGKLKNDLSAIELLEHVKLTQQNWVTCGKRKELCTQPWLSHNVSNTINVKPEEWDGVTDYIYENREYFAGISLLPISGDKDYPQAPFCAIYTPRELIQMYGDGMPLASGLIVDGLHAFDDNLWKACDYVLGTSGASKGMPVLKQPEQNKENEENYVNLLSSYILQADWIRRCIQFANRYFDDDIKQMTYCLKDVHNWKAWLDLNREYQDVDYSLMIEEEDNTNFRDTVACAGGSCELK